MFQINIEHDTVLHGIYTLMNFIKQVSVNNDVYTVSRVGGILLTSEKDSSRHTIITKSIYGEIHLR